jgi:hypothetical protein
MELSQLELWQEEAEHREQPMFGEHLAHSEPVATRTPGSLPVGISRACSPAE